PVQLNFNTSCLTNALIYKAQNPNELLRLILLNGPNCRLYQILLDHLKPFECYVEQKYT
ncbi:hypothetical protein Bpfe_001829, partial [Biomphalaria pfeifferi]